jgi:23S rRNA pseudouridine2605 synthase
MKRKTDNFNKFYNKKRNSAIKEEFRQEKKTAKKERKEGIERHFEEKRKARGLDQPAEEKTRGFGPKGKSRGAAASGPVSKNNDQNTDKNNLQDEGDFLPLNKYIAHGGICSRRDAADLIRKGKVTVNGQVVTEPGTKVLPTHMVKVNDKKVTISRNFVYILLNKPKDYITTTDDPQGRRTVLDLIRHATTERVYPVGRLDRNTSGVLLLTNDGDLSQKLAHPSHEIKKIYHVTLDKALTKADFDKIISGSVQLEDGPAIVDVMAYADPKDKTQIGLEIHSGRNRIVRRIFEHLGYDVRGLDRVMYAGLTKKNVQRGKWRLLMEKEIRILKYLNSSIKGSAAKAKDWAAGVGPVTRNKDLAAAELAAFDSFDSSDEEAAVSPKKPSASAARRPGRSAGAPNKRRSAVPGSKRPERRQPQGPASDGRPSERPASDRPASDRRAPAGPKRPERRTSNDKPAYKPERRTSTGGKRTTPADKRPAFDRPDSDRRPPAGAKRPDRRPSGASSKNSGRPDRPARPERRPSERPASERPGSDRRAPSGAKRPDGRASDKRRPESAPGRRPASSIPPKGRKPAPASNRRPRKSAGRHKQDEE